MRGLLLLVPLLLATPATASAVRYDGVYSGPDGTALASAVWLGPCQGPGTLVVDLLFTDGRAEQRRIPAVLDIEPDEYCTFTLECYQPFLMHYLVWYYDDRGRVDLQGLEPHCHPSFGALAGTLDSATFVAGTVL